MQKPLLNFLKNYRKEVDAILNEIKSAKNQVKDESTKLRLKELAFSWISYISHEKAIAGTKSGKVIQTKLDKISEFSSKRISKKKYYPLFKSIQKHLSILEIEIAKRKAIAKIEPISASQLIDQIPDLPTVLFPKALVGWRKNIEAFLDTHPFDSNIFIMVRYAKESEKLIKIIYNTIKNFNYNGQKFFPIIAKEHSITDDLNNPIACLLCCRFGIAIFDSIENKPEINPNVAYELGYMNLLQRKCLILKDDKLKSLHTDILHKLYEPYSSLEEASQKTIQWLLDLSNENF